MRVTVIATGFDIDRIPRPGYDRIHKQPSTLTPTSTTPASEPYRPPAEPIEEPAEEENLENELEVPAFIRRKLK